MPVVLEDRPCGEPNDTCGLTAGVFGYICSTMTVTVGKRIKLRREAVGLTQVSLASVVGVAPMTVSKWERGVHGLSLESLAPLAVALKCSVGWLVVGEASTDVAPAEPPKATGTGDC